jgi:hypothetical protein
MGISRAAAQQHCEADAVSGAERLETCRQESERLAEFLRHSALVSLPDAPLHISERLPCPRPQRFAMDYIPDWHHGRGTLYLTRSQAAESRPALRARCLDGGWGGAHLLAFAGGSDGQRRARALCAGASLKTAWGLYLRERLSTMGFMAADDRLHALLYRQDLLRLGLLDLDLNLGAVDTADPGAGAVELVQLARRPGDAAAGALGWQALEQARQLIEREEGNAFNERTFHDRLLSCGAIPLPLILREEFGDALWQASGRDLAVRD